MDEGIPVFNELEDLLDAVAATISLHGEHTTIVVKTYQNFDGSWFYTMEYSTEEGVYS
jgi:hypothetical protein